MEGKMETEKQGKKWAPCYVSYKTFTSFLERLKVGIPTRIDRSVVPSYSGAIQAHLFATLKYLHLMSQHGIPSERLTKLVASEGTERQKILKEILVTSYQFLFEHGIDLQRITSDELHNLFEQEGVSGGTSRKAIMFFMEAAKDAGIELSPYIGKIKATSSRNIEPRRKKTNGEKPNSIPPQEEPLSQGQNPPSWQQLLLSKFPSFDPAWQDEVKAKWFEGFNKLMEEFKKQ
jgi:hypothetical protein